MGTVEHDMSSLGATVTVSCALEARQDFNGIRSLDLHICDLNNTVLVTATSIRGSSGHRTQQAFHWSTKGMKSAAPIRDLLVKEPNN